MVVCHVSYVVTKVSGVLSVSVFLGNSVHAHDMKFSVRIRKLRVFRSGVSKASPLNDRGKLTPRPFVNVFGDLTSFYDGMEFLPYRLLESKLLISDALAACECNYETPLVLSSPVVDELIKFAMSMFRWNGRTILPSPKPELCVATDASDTGWGAVVVWARCAYRFTHTSDSWDAEQTELHINWHGAFAAT